MGILRAAGFSVILTAHALSVIDAYVYGFAMQEKALPFDTEERSIEHILAKMPEHEWPPSSNSPASTCSSRATTTARKFAWGFDLVLDGLETSLRRGPRAAFSCCASSR